MSFFHASISFTLQLAIASLTALSDRLNVRAGIISTKSVMPLIGFLDNSYLYLPKVDSIISEQHNIFSLRWLICLVYSLNNSSVNINVNI